MATAGGRQRAFDPSLSLSAARVDGYISPAKRAGSPIASAKAFTVDRA
jgi:hypothetical protein